MKGMNFFMKEEINVGIDLGGSHVSIGVVNKEGKIIEQYEKNFTIKEKENLMEVAIRLYCKNH